MTTQVQKTFLENTFTYRKPLTSYFRASRLYLFAEQNSYLTKSAHRSLTFSHLLLLLLLLLICLFKVNIEKENLQFVNL